MKIEDAAVEAFNAATESDENRDLDCDARNRIGIRAVLNLAAMQGEDCPICHGVGRYYEGTGEPSSEGNEEYRIVECCDCAGTDELRVAFEVARKRAFDMMQLYNEADADRRRLRRSLRWAVDLITEILPATAAEMHPKELEQARLDLAHVDLAYVDKPDAR